jgi:hypothetical protein
MISLRISSGIRFQTRLGQGERSPSASSDVAARAVSPASRFLPASRNSLDQPEYMDEVMPSRRHSSAMLSSPRKPSSTMRILSSAENWRRVARRISLRAASAGGLAGPDLCLIFAPDGYDEPDILRSRQPSICLKGADAGQPFAARKGALRSAG